MPYSLYVSKVCELVIPIGEATSNILRTDETTSDAESLTFIIPDDVDAVDIGIEVFARPVVGQPTESDDAYPLYDKDGVVVLSPPGTAIIISPIALPSWRLKAAAPVTNEVRISLWKSHR